MEDGDIEKREAFFKDKKKRRERQLKERKKLLDGSDSEGKENSEDGRKETQQGVYDSFTPLGSTSCAPLTQTVRSVGAVGRYSYVLSYIRMLIRRTLNTYNTLLVCDAPICA